MTDKQFIKKAYEVLPYNTVYMWGTFGNLVTREKITQKAKQYPAQYTAAYQQKLFSHVGKNVFAFDCVGLIKGILWGWNGSQTANGGTVYQSNGVPDTNTNGMESRAIGLTTDFSGIVPGEAVWMPGHIGIYVGDGKVIESTTAWDGCVQETSCWNVKKNNSLHGRSWVKHGRLPWVEYGETEQSPVGIAVGAKVKVKPGAKTYDGKGLATFVYSGVYFVREVKGDRAVIAPAMSGAVTAAVRVGDLVGG